MISLGIFIGRFQPFHKGHLHSIVTGLEQCGRLLVMIGSTHRARNVRNPFTYEERKQMLEDNLRAYDREEGTDISSRVVIGGVRDYLYNDQPWVDEVKALVTEYSDASDSIAMVGFEKDHSTYYLKLFPEYGRVPIENYQNLNATPLRHQFLENGSHQHEPFPDATQQFLAQFKFHEEFARLQEEFEFVRRYKASWADTPYPPIFATTDAVVLCANHILLVQRKLCPGKGLWALPGGFLEVNERTSQGLLRELIEETCIDVPLEQLQKSIKTMRLFDHPERSQIGRVLTHAGLIELDLPELPKVTAADDALAVQWCALADFTQLEDQLHDDHYQIVNCLLASR